MAKRTPRKPGGQVLDITVDQIEVLCRTIYPTAQDCAQYLGCSVDTIVQRIKEATGKSYPEFREASFIRTKLDLIRLAIEKAPTSDVMHKECLKHLCGWKERPVIEANLTNQVQVNNAADEEALARLEEVLRKSYPSENETIDSNPSLNIPKKLPRP